MNLVEPKIVVCLPNHDEPMEIRNCYKCGGEMHQCTASMVYKYKGEKIRVSNIQLHRCGVCRENVYSSEEAKMIEDAIEKAWSSREED